METPSAVVTLLVGVVLVLSGSAKLLNRDSFGRAAHTWGLPRALTHSVVRILPWLEIVLGSMGVAVLATPRFRLAVGFAFLGLLLAFTVVQAYLWIRRKPADCGCFARAGSMVGPSSVMRVMALTLAVTATLVWR